MKITAFVDTGWKGVTSAGGAETMIHDLMKYLVTRGWEVQACVMSGLPAHAVVDGVSVTITQDKQVVHRMAQEADVIITHLGATARTRSMAKVYGKPFVQLMHNTNHYSVGFLGDGVDLAIYNAVWVDQYHEGESQSKIIQSYQENGHSVVRARRQFDWPSITVRPPADEEQRFGGNPGGAITLVNLVPNKGPEVLYALAERYPDLHFIGVVGGYQHNLQVVRRDLPNVEIQPHTKRIDDYLERTAVALVASAYESYGRVAVEAMARGIPVLATGTPGLTEALNGAGKLTHDRANIEEWAEHLEEILGAYSAFSRLSSERYSVLVEQTEADLQLLHTTLEELVSTWRS